MGTFVLKARCKVLKSEKNEECNRRVHGRLGFKWEKEGNHGAFPSTTFTHVLLSPRGEGVPSTTTRLICAFVGGSRGLLLPSPAQTTPSRIPQDQEKAWSLWRWTFETVSSRKNQDALEGRRCEGGSAFRGPARRERPATAAGARRAPLPRHAASARVRARTRARTCPSLGLGGGDAPGGGWAAEVRGEEPELWRCCRCCRRHCRRPREEHVCNSSQESEDGHQIVPRVRPTEVDCTISLKDLRILFLYEFKLGHSAATASRNINSVFGEGSVSERTIRWWFEKFRSGDLSLKNEPRGRPKSVLNEDQLRAMVEANPKMAIRGLAADLGVSATTISRHLAAIGKVKKLDKWVGTTPTDG
ncbi:uncharacterized protein LOC106965986 [Acinonyx jubatus]|uniref:Uncharacterized protein LOC106965986 n=1 Tax=Acinonyx jubatus TaxID=32536 RepID=A0A6J1Y7L9_ACIJB|nr:uncharacterized protein LOC106965986 [Acinonyx jubatus]